MNRPLERSQGTAPDLLRPAAVLRWRGQASLTLAALLVVGLLTGCTSLHAEGGEAERIAEVLELAPGLVVADVGAGDGEWTEGLARRVGPGGRVWATEVDEEELEKLRNLVEDGGLANVEVVRGDQQSLGLPAGCCDALLVRMVYHHFEDPAAMRAELYRALRSGGRIAIIDIRPQKNWRHLEAVPDRGGHGISPADLEREMKASGFSLVELRERWNGDEERYCALFER